MADLSTVLVKDFVEQLNAKHGLGLSDAQVAAATQVLNDQAFQFLDLPSPLQDAILAHFGKKVMVPPPVVIPQPAAVSAPAHSSNSVQLQASSLATHQPEQQQSELSLVALKKAVEHISKESASDERLIQSLQTILKKAMPNSNKITQSVLRTYMKQLTQASQQSPSKAPGPDRELSASLGKLSIDDEDRAEDEAKEEAADDEDRALVHAAAAHMPGCAMPRGQCLGRAHKPAVLECGHSFCECCVHRYIMDLVGQQKAVGIVCPVPDCSREVETGAVQALLAAEEFEQYLEATLMAFIENDQLSFVCPKPGCNNAQSVQPVAVTEADAPSPMTERDEDGRPLAKDAWVHFQQFRMRCRQCRTIFCAECKHIPYHKGHTCAQYLEYQKAAHCRFCSQKLDESNTAPNPPSPALRHVCTEQECLDKREVCCLHFKGCGCPCNGVRGEDEADCLPCLKHELDIAEDYCAICYVEALQDAPCIQMTGDCNHVFHYQCVKDKMGAKWPGARISFDFRGCPTCKQQLMHPSMASFMAPILALEKTVTEKAVQRLKYEGKHKDPSVVQPDGAYYNDIVGYAMKSYLFYMCHDCDKPYFAGGYQCQEADAPFDPKELICPGCQPSSVDDCPRHGKEWLAFKCRYCCNVANWFCWGNTHFCDSCHKSGVWQKLAVFRTGKNKKPVWKYSQCAGLKDQVAAIGKDKSLTSEQKEAKLEKLRADPAKCPLRVHHPPAGFEFGLGCSMCADNKAAGANEQSQRKAQEELQEHRNKLARSLPKQGRVFQYGRDFDENGVLHFLGTVGGSQAWSNPAEAGFVKILNSGLMGDSAPASAVVGKDLVRCVSKPVANSWFVIDLQDFELEPTFYTLKHYSSWDTECLRSWEFEGSSDGVTFHSLVSHRNDRALAKKGATKTWPVQSQGRRFRMFRVIQTGRNSNKNHYLALSGMELYGRLYPRSAQPRASPLAAGGQQSVVSMHEYQPAKGAMCEGILYHLGTQLGTQVYRNPGAVGLVTVTASSLADNPPSSPAHCAVGREVVRCVTLNQPQQWFKIDLKQNRCCPSHYMLRHYNSWHLEALRSWSFEGSNDGARWTLLRKHVNDDALDAKGKAHVWKLDNVPAEGFSMFRVFQTGKNSNNHHYLALSGFELFGKLMAAPPQGGGALVARQQQPLQQKAPALLPSPHAYPAQQPRHVASSGPVNLQYTFDFDMNGVFYYLGSRNKTEAWRNPAELGLVTVTCSQLAKKPPSAPVAAVVGREVVRCVTISKPHQWFCVDLHTRRLRPSHYTLRHYSSWDTEALRSWNLDASVDGVRWDTLRQHHGDSALSHKGASHTWGLPPTQVAYRFFRVLQTGRNSNNNHYLALSGMELYGYLTDGAAASAMPHAGMRPPMAVPMGQRQPFVQPSPLMAGQAPLYQGQHRPPYASHPALPGHLGHPVHPAAQPPRLQPFREGMMFTPRHDFDENGILYYIGTNQGTRSWSNPGKSGAVLVTSSVLNSTRPNPSMPAWAITGRRTERCVTVAQKDAWFCIDFLKYQIRPTHYTLRHYSSWDTEALRDWTLTASNDGRRWTKLMSHKQDTSLQHRGSTKTWAIPDPKKSYRLFRIVQTGKNSNGHWYMALSGFEIYGYLSSRK